MYDLLWKMQIPNCINAVAANSTFLKALHLTAFMKFKLVDVYSFVQSNEPTPYLVRNGFRAIFLLYMFEFALLMSSNFTRPYSLPAHLPIARRIQGAASLVGTVLIPARTWSLQTLITRITLGIVENGFYCTELENEKLLSINHGFYTAALHTYMVARMSERCQSFAMMCYAAYLNALFAFFRIHLFHISRDAVMYPTIAAAFANLFILWVVDDAEVETEVMLLLAATLCETFQSFGHFSSLFVQNIFELHFLVSFF
jgi:hypothetical protein